MVSEPATTPLPPLPWRRFLVLPVATPRERRLRSAVWIAAGVIVVGIIGAILAAVFHRKAVAIALAFPLWAAVVFLVRSVVLLSVAHFEARRGLDRAGYRVCPGCEYDLAALPESGVCPECGREYDPVLLRMRWREIYDRLEKRPNSALISSSKRGN